MKFSYSFCIYLNILFRFVNQGYISFSNINAILPNSFGFTYNDDANMFNVKVTIKLKCIFFYLFSKN